MTIALPNATHGLAPYLGRLSSRDPDGDGVDEAPAATLDGTWLKTTADALNPGEWHYGVDASLPNGFTGFAGLINAGSEAAGATKSSNIYWGPIALWSSTDTKSYMIADRTSGPSTLHAVSFFGYDAQNHAWVQYPVVDRSDTDFGSPHVYGRWALDTSRQNFYRMAGGGYSFDMSTDVWTETGDLSAWDSNGRMSSYFPEIDRVVVMNGDGEIIQWNPDTGTTSTLTTNSIPALATAGNNHGHSVYNETRQEVAFFSNVENGQIGLLDSSGVLTEGATFPYTNQQAKFSTTFLFYDPISGHYLVFLRDDKELWEYDAATDQWALALSLEGTAAEWPTYNGMLITVIQELNTIMWLHKSEQRLYKHSAVI